MQVPGEEGVDITGSDDLFRSDQRKFHPIRKNFVGHPKDEGIAALSGLLCSLLSVDTVGLVNHAFSDVVVFGSGQELAPESDALGFFFLSESRQRLLDAEGFVRAERKIGRLEEGAIFYEVLDIYLIVLLFSFDQFFKRLQAFRFVFFGVDLEFAVRFEMVV